MSQVGQEVIWHNFNIQPTLLSRSIWPVRIIINLEQGLRSYKPLLFSKKTSR
ncbi:hypothetical protein [Stenotrophomonas maltophilia]|uniref:hypothetical protein n=1 Tax=Stenotrophomonas maltophilia TaxID=40324 RepID=UPI0039C2250B